MKKKKKYYAFVAGFCVMLAGALFLCGRSESALGTDGVVVMQQRSETGAQPETAREPPVTGRPFLLYYGLYFAP